jgi:uncharacterized protein YyaL (SSP411 family)
MTKAYQARLTMRARPALALSAMAALGTQAPTNAEGTPMSQATPVGAPATFEQMIDEMWTAIREHFYRPDQGLYTEYYPTIPGRTYSYLWPYSGVLSAANARAHLHGDEASAADLRTTLEHLEQYFDAQDEPPGYDSYPVELGGGTRFYDDNQWLGIDAIYAYRLLGDEALLEKSKIIWDFSISGWSDELGGGIYWNEDEKETKNTCSNGPAAVHALLVHEETGEQEYLDWAIRIMEWLDANLYDDTTGVYHDNIRLDGTIDEAKYTYNAGTPLHAFALLHKATGEATYLERARTLAADSLAHFAPTTVGDDVSVFPATPWFNSILMRGYAALYEVDPEPDASYLNAIASLLAHAWQHNRDTDGFMHPDWGMTAPTTHARWLLDQAPVIEIAALAAKHIG